MWRAQIRLCVRFVLPDPRSPALVGREDCSSTAYQIKRVR